MDAHAFEIPLGQGQAVRKNGEQSLPVVGCSTAAHDPIHGRNSRDLRVRQGQQRIPQPLGARIDGQGAGVPGGGALGIGKLRTASIAQPDIKRNQLGLRALAHPGSEVQQILPALRGGKEIEHGRRCPGITGRAFQNLGQRRDGVGRILELIAFDLGHAHEIGATLDPGHIGARPPRQGHH